jgi:Na+/H+ antiporter NhaD/arsenite permease-like protein
MPTVTPARTSISARIASRHDWLPALLWTAAVILLAAAAATRPGAVLPAARATLGPFAMLAVIIAGSVLAGRIGLFRAFARLLIPDRAPRPVAAGSVLVFTALLAGLANLDVAVVVAMPVAMQAAARHAVPAGRLTAAVALTANCASFLLPTSNITSLLLLERVRLAPLAYLRGSWLPWLLVVTVTIGSLSCWLARAGTSPAVAGQGRPSGGAALDLIPMYVGASSIRAILVAGITLRGGLAAQLAVGSALASVVNNLPAAAALRPDGTAGLWAAILATAIGPGLLITGSVATVICRRIGRESGAALRAWQVTAIGLVLVPAQLTAAVIGLHFTGALS